MIANIICLSCVIVVVNSAAMVLKIPPTPKELAHKQGCFITEINDVIPFNESVSLVGACEKRTCKEDQIGVYTCGAMRAPSPECFLTKIDYSRPYPDCCRKQVCDIGENLLAEQITN